MKVCDILVLLQTISTTHSETFVSLLFDFRVRSGPPHSIIPKVEANNQPQQGIIVESHITYRELLDTIPSHAIVMGRPINSRTNPCWHKKSFHSSSVI